MSIPLNFVSLENFKSFEAKTNFDLAQLTLLIGQNNSGKSSVLQALKLLSDSLQKDGRTKIDLESFLQTVFELNNLQDRYGNIKNVVSRNSDSNIVNICFDIEDVILLTSLQISISLKIERENYGYIDKIEVINIRDYNIIYSIKREYLFESSDIFNPTDYYRYNINQLALKKIFDENIHHYNDLIDKTFQSQFDTEYFINNKLNDFIIYTLDLIRNVVGTDEIFEYANSYIDVLNSFVNIDSSTIEKNLKTFESFLNGKFIIEGSFDDLTIEQKNLILFFLEDLFYDITLYKKSKLNLEHINFKEALINIFEYFFFESYINLDKFWINDPFGQKQIPDNYEAYEKRQQYQDEIFEVKLKIKNGFLEYNPQIPNTFHFSLFLEWEKNKENLFLEINQYFQNSISNLIPKIFKEYKTIDLEAFFEDYIIEEENIFDFEIFKNLFKNNRYNKNAYDDISISRIAMLSEKTEKSVFKNFKNLLEDENIYFVETVKKAISNFLDIDNIDYKNLDRHKEIELKLLEVLSEAKLLVTNENNALSLFDFLIQKSPGNTNNLKELKEFDFLVQITLDGSMSDINSSFNLYHIYAKQYDKFLKGGMHYPDIEYYNKLTFFNLLSLLIFLKENNLTQLVRKINWDKNLAPISRFKNIKSIINSNENEQFYSQLLKNINITLILSNLENYHLKNNYNYYSLFQKMMNNSFSNLHNNIRTKLISQIFFLPAIKSTLKRHISLNEYLDPLVHIINRDKHLNPLESQNHNKNFSILISDDDIKATYSYTNKYFKITGLAFDFKITLFKELRIAKFEIIDTKGETRNYVEEGHGIAQLCILCHSLHIIEHAKTPTIIMIEEPEIGLHPSLQSKLADILCLAIYNGIQIIVETHSEYLVRKLQYLTATKKVTQDSVTIYYFNMPSNPDMKRHYKIDIKSNGLLSDNFGNGFYDEASNISLELFFQQYEKNN
jgi:predicted ATPase